MVRRNLDDIEIVEPPLEELTKTHSHKRACATGCGCIVFLIIALVIGLKIYIGPGPQALPTVPKNFPADIPIYDRDNIEEITFISGRYKNRGIEVATFFPKIILSPLLLKFNDQNEPKNSDNKPTTLKTLWQIITTPVGDHRDTIQIEWVDLNTDYDFVNSYYKKEMVKNGFKIEQESEGEKVMQFSFVRAQDGLSGSFYSTGREDGRGTSYAILTVNLSNTNP